MPFSLYRRLSLGPTTNADLNLRIKGHPVRPKKALCWRAASFWIGTLFCSVVTPSATFYDWAKTRRCKLQPESDHLHLLPPGRRKKLEEQGLAVVNREERRRRSLSVEKRKRLLFRLLRQRTFSSLKHPNFFFFDFNLEGSNHYRKLQTLPNSAWEGWSSFVKG